MNGDVALIIPNFVNVFTTSILQKAFKTNSKINEELKRTESDGPFCKKFKLLTNRFCSRTKSVEKNDPAKED